MAETPPSDAQTVGMHVMDTDVFHVALEGVWRRLDMPNARPGDAAFEHPDLGYSLFQTVVVPGESGNKDRKTVLTDVMSSRLEGVAKNGHTLQPGKVGFTEEDWGWVGVCDVVLDGRRYAVMAGYAFEELVLIHWIDGPPGQEDRIKQELLKIMATVSYRSPGSSPAS